MSKLRSSVVGSMVFSFALAVLGFAAQAEVDVNALLNESAMWLDAADPALLQCNEAGGVTNWINRSTSGRATYGDAHAYEVNPGAAMRYGSVESVNGAPAYQMFNTGSCVDLAYERISTIRTVFLVGDFENVGNAWNPLLGDSDSCNFHRGQNGEFIHSSHPDYKGGRTAWFNNATTAVNPAATKPTPGTMNFIILATDGDTKSNQLGRDRNYTNRTAGRALHEVIIFTRALTDAERTAVYDYLYAKWHDGGWDNGQYEMLAAYGGPASVTFTEDVTVGASTDPEKRLLAEKISVAAGKTATLASPLTGGSVNLTGGGTLAFADGATIYGKLSQTGGTLDLGGGTLTTFVQPALSGEVTIKNGCIDLSASSDRFRPPANTHFILGPGASLINGGDLFPDNGNVVFEMQEGAGIAETRNGCFGLTVDYNTSNTLVVAGGTLVATNTPASDDNNHGVVKILTQKAGGTAVMKMTGGEILARRLSVAGSWNTTEVVNGRAFVDITGGLITLLDEFQIGANNGAHGTATVHFGGGTVKAPNGLHMYYNDSDTVTFDGTTFVATKDNANYFNFAKDTSAYVTVAEGGLILDDGGFAISVDLGKVGGTGPVVKRGAGTLTLGNASSYAGPLTIEAGTVVLGSNRLDGLLSIGADGGTLDVIVLGSELNQIAPVAQDFDVTKLTLIARNEQGTVIADAKAVVDSGFFCVKMPESYVAEVKDATLDWFALPWTFCGLETTFPETDGVVVESVLNASGTSEITLGKTIYSPLTKIRNADANAAEVTLKGPAEHTGRIDLSDFNGTVRAEKVKVGGEIALGGDSTLELYAADGETWTGGVSRVTGGTATKTGAGTVVNQGAPDAAIEVTEGVLGLLVNDETSVSALDVTSANRTGVLEKRGSGTLTLTGTGPAGVQIKVLEGTLAVAKDAPTGVLSNITATAEKPFWVAPGATAIIDGDNDHTERLPDNSSIVVDGGTLVVRGTNPLGFGNLPLVDVTDGIVEINHCAGKEHIKFRSLTLKDSVFKFTGTKGAYSSQGAVMKSPYEINTSGECLFDQVEGSNRFVGEGEIQLDVSVGTTVWNIPVGTDVRKKGAGTLCFGPKKTNSGSTFVIAEGPVANGVAGGACAKLRFEAGTVLKAVDGDPLAVDTITMPSSGSVTLDLTGIDFENRTEPLRILDCAAFSPAMAEKLTVLGMPGAPWQMSTAGGITLRRIAQPQELVWNTGNGCWTETEWNNDPAGYGMDGYHTVIFADSTNGATSATVAVTENRIVSGLEMKAAQTAYRIAGPGEVTAPSFLATGAAPFTFAAPLRLVDGGITFAATAADQSILGLCGAIGAVEVPAAAGGTALLTFVDGSATSAGAITIGAGKTLELRNSRSSASIHLDGAVSSPVGSKIVISSSEPALQHIDFKANSPDMLGSVEIRDGGYLHVDAQFDKITATVENPVWVHGANSVLSLYGSQKTNRFPANGHVCVTDGGRLLLRGVNLFPQQWEGPCVTVSNATLEASNEKFSGGCHLHVRDVNLYDKGVLEMTETASAYYNQGLVVWGKIIAVEGDSIVRRIDGNPNYFCFYDSDRRLCEGAVEVREDARMVFDNAAFSDAPHKTGAGTLVLGERPSVFGTGAKTLKLDEGYLLANAMTETANDNLTTVQVASGAGFDLSERVGELPWTPAFALTLADATERTVVRIKLPEGKLKNNDKVIAWTTPPADLAKMTFVDAARRVSLVKRSDGVYVSRGFILLFK